MTRTAEEFFRSGCGRCPLGGTPACKAAPWSELLAKLRAMLLDSDLIEDSKWGFPCYTLGGRNVALLAAWKEGCTISFFKGALVADPARLLELPGPNCRAARVVRLRGAEDLDARREAIRALILSAIEVERSGLRMPPRDTEDALPAELAERLDSDPELAAAYFALTPGRQRGYILNISGAKKSETRAARVEKWAPRILSGRGIHD